MRRCACVACGFVLGVYGHIAPAAVPPRLSPAELEFRAANPCPAKGAAQDACKGHVVDRIIPRICGGNEHASNMQWLTLAEAKAKSRWDRIGCRAGRRLVLPSEFTSTTEAFPLGDAPAPVQVQPLGAGSKRVERAPKPAEPQAPASEPAEAESGASEEPELPHQ
jgi:hypothetical protein